MEEFCPEGWTAQLTLYGSPSQLPDDAPEAGDVRVSLEWAERAEDRRLDAELEAIERAAAEDDPAGPDAQGS